MSEVARCLELVQASEDTMPAAKAIITKVPMNFARCLFGGIAFGQEKLKLLNSKNKALRQLNKDPLVSKAMQVFRRFTLKEIRATTNNFDKDLVVGESAGYLIVYRGLIDNGNLQVAVKRWNEVSSESLGIFNADILVQSQIHYLHLVSMIGYCIEKNELITVYEYMVHGSLHTDLYKSHDPLPWEKRLQVCIGAARGIHYLHAGAKQPIIHRNLKPTNILLDQDWVAKICGGEFPTLIPQDQSASFDPLVAGTLGYIDPEYILSGRFSVKSDVYSFGAILLELLCGRQPMIYSRDPDQVNLVRWFNTNMEMDTLDQIIDPRLIDEIAPECLNEYVKIAEKCTRTVGFERPSMENVLDTPRYALQLQETWEDHKQCGAMFSKPNSLSRVNSFPKGILLVESSEGGTNRTSSTILEDSDYLSENLAR